MYLESLRFQNFRLIHDATLKVGNQTTLIVGRNNSAKTSCMELMNKVLKTSRDKRGFTVDQTPGFDDYPLRLRPRLYANVLKYLQGKIDFVELEESFEAPSLTFIVKYGDESEDAPLGELSNFIIDLDPDIDYVVIKAAYTFSPGSDEFLKAFDNHRKLYYVKTSDDVSSSTQQANNVIQDNIADEITEDDYENDSEINLDSLYDGTYDDSEDTIQLALEPKLRILSRGVWKRADIQKVLREHWEKWLRLKVWSIYPETNPDSCLKECQIKEVECYKLRELFPFYAITAERALGEDDARHRNTLGEIVNYYFNLQDKNNAQYSKEMQDLRRQIALINRSLETQSAKQLEILLNKTSHLGRLTDTPLYLSVSTKLNLSDEISRHTDLLYRENPAVSQELNALHQGYAVPYPLTNQVPQPQATTYAQDVPSNRTGSLAGDDHKGCADDIDTDAFKDDSEFEELLPNTHNGLGYKNLIKMEFQLTAFVNTLKGTDRCLPLLFIEEPESHMHPQLQEIFVTALHRFMVEQIGDKRVHIFISSHSPHIANSLNFSDLRYALRSTGNIEYREICNFMQAWQERHRQRTTLSNLSLTDAPSSKRDDVFADSDSDKARPSLSSNNSSYKQNLSDLPHGQNTSGLIHPGCKHSPEAAASQDENCVPTELKPRDKALQLFIHKYLSLTKCDLYFADKLILVEGETEKMLLPEMIKEVCGPQMRPQYYSILVIGGAYAHKLIPLIDFLRIRTLILTDLDCFYDARFDKALHKNSSLTGPASHQGGFTGQKDNVLANNRFSEAHASQNAPSDSVKQRRKLEEKPIAECNVCTNATLKFWLTEMLTPARPVKNEADTYCELFDSQGEDRLKAEDKTVGLIHLEYQTTEDTGTRGRSFEEALYCAQTPSHPLFKNAKQQSVSFKGNKIDFALSLLDAQIALQLNNADGNRDVTEEKAATASTRAIHNFRRASAATENPSDSVPLSAASGLSYKVPRYIREGLSWLFELPSPQRSPESCITSTRLYASQPGDSRRSKE